MNTPDLCKQSCREVQQAGYGFGWVIFQLQLTRYLVADKQQKITSLQELRQWAGLP